MAGQSMVDFSYLHGGSALDPLAQSIENMGNYAVEERNRKQKMEEDRLKNDREYSLRSQDVANRTAAEARREHQQNAQLEVENTQRAARAKEQIRKDVASGDLDSARIHAQDYAEVNPNDNSVKHGLDFEVLPPRDVGPAPTEPTGPTHVEEGPRETPEIAKQAGLIRSLQQTPSDAPPEVGAASDQKQIDAAEAERKRFEQANDPAQVQKNVQAQAAFPGQQAAYQADVKNAQNDRRVRIGGVETSTDELRHSADRQAAADFAKVGDALTKEMSQILQSGDPRMRADGQRRLAQFQTLQAAVEAGTLKPADAMKRMATQEDLYGKYGAQREHDTTVGEYGLQKQALANQRPQAGHGAPVGATVDPKAFSAAEAALEHFQKNFNIPANRAEDAKLNSLIKNKDKAIVQRAITSVLSRGLAGEKGVLTDQDISRLQKNLGGAWPEVQNWFSKGATGTLAPEIMSRLEEGINTVLQQHEASRAQGKEAYDKTFGPTSPLQKWGLGEHLKNKRAEMFGEDAPAAGQQVNPAAVDDIMSEWKKRQGGR